MKKSNFKRALAYPMAFALAGSLFITSCNKEELEAPEEENVVEEFTNIEFIFTNVNDPNDVSKGIWEDEDGFGPMEPVIKQHPKLKANQTYNLTFLMENRLVSPVENVLEEIMDEDDEHQIFFAFDEGMFSSPEGVGNIADNSGQINYLDFDDNGLPLGLQTEWTTAGPVTEAKFRAVLAHKPDVKGPNSSWNSGDIDWDITFSIDIQE
jgi:hypothetical protein